MADCRVNKVDRIRFNVSKTNVVRFMVKVITIHKTVTDWILREMQNSGAVERKQVTFSFTNK